MVMDGDAPPDLGQAELVGDPTSTHDDVGLPVYFGRPDLGAHMAGVGRRWKSFKVSVYACGPVGLVDSLQESVESCNREGKQFSFAHERFD